MRDEAPTNVGGELDPVIEESAGRNAGKFEEAALNDSSLDRILNPCCCDVNNQDDVDIPSYNGSANSVGDLWSIGLFETLDLK